MNQLTNAGLLRLPQIIGQNEVTEEQAAENRRRKKGPKTARPKITPIIPVGKSSWWAGVRNGHYPSSIKLSQRTTVWRAEDVYKLVTKVGE